MIDTKNILKDECNIVLNEKQVEAVESEADNCIVVAGAGTGKTTTLAAKAKYLVKEKGIDPKRILILSFSNKSVNDIRKKIKYTLNLDCEIRTFHSLGLKIWNDYRNSVEADFKDDDSETIGQINNKIITSFCDSLKESDAGYDEYQKVCKKAEKKNNNYFNDFDKKLFIKNMRYFISLFEVKVHNDREVAFASMLAAAKSDEDREYLEMYRNFYEYYQNYKKENHMISFGDMITRAIDILEEKEIILPYDHIFVDEFQDISKTRYDFIKRLKECTNAKLTVVGDDWQSIYAFSGSEIRLFTQFKELIDGEVQEITLDETQRNAQQLLDIAGEFIMEDDRLIQKSLKSDKEIKNPIIFFIEDSDYKPGLFDVPRVIVMAGVEKPQIPLKEMVVKIVEQRKEEKRNVLGSIILLGRYGDDFYKVKDFLIKGKDSNGEEAYFLKTEDELKSIPIYFYTIHKAKGLEGDDVILLNASSADSTFGKKDFPCTIDVDSRLSYINDVSDDIYFETTEELDDKDKQYEEERRLFYVALTRTRNRVYIVPKHRSIVESSFITELKDTLRKNDMDIIEVPISTTSTKNNDSLQKEQIIVDGKCNLELLKQKYPDEDEELIDQRRIFVECAYHYWQLKGSSKSFGPSVSSVAYLLAGNTPTDKSLENMTEEEIKKEIPEAGYFSKDDGSYSRDNYYGIIEYMKDMIAKEIFNTVRGEGKYIIF